MADIKEITVAELPDFLAKGAQLIDVREDEELEDGKIPGCAHMPLSSFEDFRDVMAKDKTVVFYCRSGRRSLKAGEIASQWTDQPIFSLKGGYLEYSNQH